MGRLVLSTLGLSAEAWEAWGGLGNSWECFREAWGGLGNVWECFGEAWGGLGRLGNAIDGPKTEPYAYLHKILAHTYILLSVPSTKIADEDACASGHNSDICSCI